LTPSIMFLGRIGLSVSKSPAYNILSFRSVSASYKALECQNKWLPSAKRYHGDSIVTSMLQNFPANRSHNVICKSILYPSNFQLNGFSSSCNLTRHFSSSSAHRSKKVESRRDDIDEESEKKLGLIQRYKLMMKRYGYVCIPVHFAIAPLWYGSFFLAAKMGVDIMPLLEHIGVVPLIESLSPSLVEKLHQGGAGNHLVALALYKVSTPLRYMVTLGASTYVINYLKFYGYIKPMTKKNIKGMYDDKKEEFQEMYEDRKEEFQEMYEDKKEEFAQSKKHLQGMYRDKKEEFVESRKRLGRIYEVKRRSFQRKHGNKFKSDLSKKVISRVKNGRNGKNGKKY